MRNIYYIVLVLFSATLLSCKGSKEATSTPRVKTGLSEATSLYARMVDGGDYTWYTGKARVKAMSPIGRMSATVNLRMHRDSVIWMTIDKLGFEVARILITPDSVFAVDRMNKEYTREALTSYLLDYGVHLGFKDIQSVLVGKMIALNPTHLETRRDDGSELLLVSDQSGITAKHWVSMTLPQRLLKSFVVDASGRKLWIENSDWETLRDGTQMPYNRVFAFEDSDGTTEIQISFSEISKNIPANIPFSIPDHYARAR